jgi:hypothetical protein
VAGVPASAAGRLRRPLLVTGDPGSGKSTLIESVARELKLGTVLRWHITSRSTLTDALYRYDVLGRIHAQQFAKARGEAVTDDITDYLQLGPLGAALASDEPRALLIDELDKSDLDLPSDPAPGPGPTDPGTGLGHRPPGQRRPRQLPEVPVHRADQQRRTELPEAVPAPLCAVPHAQTG